MISVDALEKNGHVAVSGCAVPQMHAHRSARKTIQEPGVFKEGNKPLARTAAGRNEKRTKNLFMTLQPRLVFFGSQVVGADVR